MYPAKRLNKGEIYIGVLISLGIFLILSQAVVTLVLSAYDLVSYTRARTTAKQIATEKQETLRNMPFDDVGTVGGIPSGTIPQTETILINGLTYTVRTSIIYIDDIFDGQAPDDLLPIDYKRARIDVSWGGISASNTTTITLISDIAPKGIETMVGGGTLSILVFNSLGEPVPQADVRIVASSVNPPVDLSLKTNNNGRVILPGAPICNNCYQVFASKEGFSTERTYSTNEIANPAKPNLTILEAQVTEVSFAIDQVSTVTLVTVNDRENNFSPRSNQTVHVRGEKLLGTDTLDAPVYKFDQDVTTNSAGQYVLSNVEWDNYYITLPSSTTLDFAGTNPLTPLIVNANQTLNLTMALSNQTAHRLLTLFTDPADTPIASVSARLSGSPTFEASASSGLSADPDYGHIFWKNLNSQTYLLEASASGYATYSANVNVSGYTKETIILTPQ